MSKLLLAMGVGKRRLRAPSIDAAALKNEKLAIDFVISARSLGEFDGPIYIIDFGTTKEFKQCVRAFDAILIEPKNKYSVNVSVERMLQYKRLIEEGIFEAEYMSFHDSDVWWQRPVEPVIELCPPKGVSFAPSHRRMQKFPDAGDLEEEFERRLDRFVSECGRALNIGYMAASKDNMLHKLEQFEEFVKRDDVSDFFTLDQVAYIWQHNYQRDKINGAQFNGITHGRYEPEELILDFKGRIAHAVHLAGGRKAIEEHWFRNRHKDIFDSYMKRVK